MSCLSSASYAWGLARVPAPRRRPARRGLSLLEVLVAVVIFLLAFVAIGELISQSARRAAQVSQREQAALLCETKLAEIVAGAIPLGSQEGVPFEEDPTWLWSLQCEQSGQVTGLWNVQVRVSRTDPDGTQVSCVLNQMVLDPSLRGNTADTTTVAGTESTDAGTTGTTTGGSTTSGTTTPQGGR